MVCGLWRVVCGLWPGGTVCHVLGENRGLMRREDWDSGLDGVWVAGRRKNRRYGHDKSVLEGVAVDGHYSYIAGRVLEVEIVQKAKFVPAPAGAKSKKKKKKRRLYNPPSTGLIKARPPAREVIHRRV